MLLECKMIVLFTKIVTFFTGGNIYCYSFSASSILNKDYLQYHKTICIQIMRVTHSYADD